MLAAAALLWRKEVCFYAHDNNE